MFIELNKILKRSVRSSGLERSITAAQVVEKANELLDEWYGKDTTQQHARAISYKAQKLAIATLHSGLREELMNRQEEFVSAVNQKMEQNIVARLQLRI